LGEIVIVKVKSVKKDKKMFVSLLEYNNINGLIEIIDNLSNSHNKKDINGHVKKKQEQFPAIVLSIKKEKGFIKLSECNISDAKESDAKTRIIYIYKNNLYNRLF